MSPYGSAKANRFNARLSVAGLIFGVAIAAYLLWLNERNHRASRDDRITIHGELDRARHARQAIKQEQAAIADSVHEGRREIVERLERIEGKVDRLGGR